LGVIYLFTHDSVALGEDGPTHQPVEQLSNLRAVPNLRVIRPCDANEVTCAWRVALENRTGPTALILSRQNVPVLDRAKLYPASGLLRGGYVISDSLNGFVDIILAASGSEVSLALAASDRLADQGVGVRVVSMPGWDLFDEQPKEYRDSVFPPDLRVRMSIEAAGPQGWERYLGDQGECLGVRTFGASAPGEVVLQQYGFSVDNVVDRALALLGRPL
jgi:transketolase